MHIPVSLEIPAILGMIFLTFTVPFALVSCAIVWGVRAIFGLRAGVITGWVALALSPLVPIALLSYVAADADAKFVGDEFVDNDGAGRTFAALLLLSPPALISNAVAVGVSIAFFNRRRRTMASAQLGV